MCRFKYLRVVEFCILVMVSNFHAYGHCGSLGENTSILYSTSAEQSSIENWTILPLTTADLGVTDCQTTNISICTELSLTSRELENVESSETENVDRISVSSADKVDPTLTDESLLRDGDIELFRDLGSGDGEPSSVIPPKSTATPTNPNCFAIPKFGTCPPPNSVPSGTNPCGSSSQCTGNEICCQSTATSKFCTKPFSKKPGECPSPESVNLQQHLQSTPCYLDENCGGRRKCCKITNCKYECLDIPLQTHTTHPTFVLTTSSTCKSIPKFGKCPPSIKNAGKSCSSHYDCIGNKLCCPDNSGKKCSDPDSKIFGECPAPYNLFNPGSSYCYTDDNCGLGRKCCMETPCAYRCSDIIKPSLAYPTNSIPVTPPGCFSIPKFGFCPSKINEKGSICKRSSECRGNKICCKEKCNEPYSTKRGNCPAPNRLINQGSSPCYVDSNCGRGRRCCEFTSCEYRCSDVDI